MSAEFSGVPEKVHGVIASHSLCYQCLEGKPMNKNFIYTIKEKEFKKGSLRHTKHIYIPAVSALCGV